MDSFLKHCNPLTNERASANGMQPTRGPRTTGWVGERQNGSLQDKDKDQDGDGDEDGDEDKSEE